MTSLDHVDRRRLVAATAITLIALPSLWLTSRADESAAPNVATAGVIVSPETPAVTEPTTRALDALGAPGGAFLDQPEFPLHEPSEPSESGLRIAVPASPARDVLEGRATFRSSLASTDVCAVRGAPFGVRVRVTNRDNGHSVTCVASVAWAGGSDDAVLHTSTFARIADLTNAPVPVEIVW